MQYVTNAARRLRVLAVLFVLAAAFSAAQVTVPADNPKRSDTEEPDVSGSQGNSAQVAPRSEIPVQEWLQGPVRKDFAWNVRALPPILTFEQRHLVEILAMIRVGSLRKAGLSSGRLSFVLKLAGEDGRWLPGDSRRRVQLQPDLSSSDEIHSLFGVYVQPGTYQIALAAYDRRTHKRNLWRGKVRVPPVSGDPLPGIDRNLPVVEFLPPSPPVGRGLVMSYDPWAYGQGNLVLPVQNTLPVEVDVVANLSLSNTTRSRRAEAPDWIYQLNAAIVTAASRVITEMKLANGCIRVSALDIPRHELFVDREEIRSFEWSRIQLALKAIDRSKIDARVLAGERKTPAFLARYLAQLASDSPKCGMPGGPPPARVLIVVGDAFIFPDGAEMVQASPTNAWSLCFYIELVSAAGPRWDQLASVLKPLNPVRLEVSTPVGLRKALAQMIREIENVSAGTPLPGPPR